SSIIRTEAFCILRDHLLAGRSRNGNCRKRNAERASAAEPALHSDGALVGRHDESHNAQAEAAPAPLARESLINLVKILEYFPGLPRPRRATYQPAHASRPGVS